MTAVYLNGDPLWLDIESGSGGSYLRKPVGTADITLQQATAGQGIQFAVAGGQKVFIDADGNLGIGTTQPLDNLDVRGSIRLPRLADPLNHALRLGSQLWQGATDKWASVTTRGGVDQHLFLNPGRDNANVNGNIVLAYDVPGNVGIGIVIPGAKLHVVGGEIRTDTGFRATRSGNQGYVWLDQDGAGGGQMRAVPAAEGGGLRFTNLAANVEYARITPTTLPGGVTPTGNFYAANNVKVFDSVR